MNGYVNPFSISRSLPRGKGADTHCEQGGFGSSCAGKTARSMIAHDKLPHGRLLAYGGPLLAISSLLFFVQFYFLKFATDVLLLPPATVGVLFALVKLWDAASNPLVGSWSDRTRSRFGRRRPFLLGSL